MRELQELARGLLTQGAVKVVIGYEEGPRGPRPAFVTRPEDAGKLIFDHRCLHNLAVYLNPRRAQIAALGRPAVVVKGCDLKAVAAMVRETQIKREDVVLIAMRCGGVVRDPAAAEPLGEDTVAARCQGCDARDPQRADHILGTPLPAPPVCSARRNQVAGLRGRPPGERWAFWSAEFARCLRCHACREICPICFCERCLADKAMPQWIDPSPHPRGNFAWQMSRVLHGAGRCADCGECERACPAEIPLGLLTQFVAEVMESRFSHQASDDPALPSPIGTFRQDDAQEFIR